MDTIDKKIYFFRVSDGEKTPKQIYYDFLSFKEKSENSPLREMLIDKDYGYLNMSIKSFDEKRVHGIIQKIRTKDLPMRVKLSKDKNELSPDDLDENTSLMERTHFIYYFDKRVLVAEYNHFGERPTTLKHVLSEHIDDSKLIIKPILSPEAIVDIVKGSALKKFELAYEAPAKELVHQYFGTNINEDLDDIFNGDIVYERNYYAKGKKATLVGKGSKFVEKVCDFARDVVANKSDDNNSPYNNVRKVKASSYVKTNKDDEEEKYALVSFDLLEEKIVSTVSAIYLMDNKKYIDSSDFFKKIERAYEQKKFLIDK